MAPKRSLHPVRAYEILEYLDTPRSVTEIFNFIQISYEKTKSLIRQMEERELIEKGDTPIIRFKRSNAVYYVVTLKGSKLREDVKPLMTLREE